MHNQVWFSFVQTTIFGLNWCGYWYIVIYLTLVASFRHICKYPSNGIVKFEVNYWWINGSIIIGRWIQINYFWLLYSFILVVSGKFVSASIGFGKFMVNYWMVNRPILMGKCKQINYLWINVLVWKDISCIIDK